MIITKSPLRITLGGGGTDLPSYYRDHGGFVVSAAIDKYVYITLHSTFARELIVKYSRMERVKRARELEHPLLREVLLSLGFEEPGLEITSMADIPAGTGLGSSGSFTTALILALTALDRRRVEPAELAEHACRIEIDVLANPVGKQDPYAASFGGLHAFHIAPDGAVTVEPLRLAPRTLYDLEDNLVLFFTGFSRSAPEILAEQDRSSRAHDPAITEHLHRVKEIGVESKALLEQGDLDRFGELMHTHWLLKRQRSARMSNPEIDAWYELGMRNGARGGKIVGAGGGGFLMFYANDKSRIRRAMAEAGLPEVRFRFEFRGTQVVSQP